MAKFRSTETFRKNKENLVSTVRFSGVSVFGVPEGAVGGIEQKEIVFNRINCFYRGLTTLYHNLAGDKEVRRIIAVL